MKRVGTFYDNTTKMDYDLYTINASKLKVYVDNSYPLTPFKINLFNDGTRLRDNVGTEKRYNNLQVDLKNGVLLNPEEYFSSTEKYRVRVEDIQESVESTTTKNSNNDYHILGFETTPFVISLNDKDIKNINELELIDGFKRMFWTYNIPDMDVFLKVYDVMDTIQWINAMLLYNSWKIPMGAVSFIDRGFKLGLYKHFDIDLTLYDSYCHKTITEYVSSNPYSVLIDNKFIDKDIQLLIDLYLIYVEPLNEKTSSIFGMLHFLYMFAELLSNLRKMEHKLNMRENSKVITTDFITEFLDTSDMKKHIKKINSLSVPGRMDNYSKEKMIPLIFNHLRKFYGVSVDELPETAYYKDGSLKEGYRLFFVSNDKITEKYKKEEERLKNRRLEDFLY